MLRLEAIFEASSYFSNAGSQLVDILLVRASFASLLGNLELYVTLFYVIKVSIVYW